MWTDRRVLLVAGGSSLLLNVFLVGLVVGQSVIGRGSGHPRGQAEQQGRHPVAAGPANPGPVVHQGHVRLLSVDERHRFQAAMKPHRPAIRAAREILRARRQAVEAAIVAPDYDREAVAAAFAGLRSAEGDLAMTLHGGLVDALAALPQPARAALVAHDRPVDNGNGAADRTGEAIGKAPTEGEQGKARPGTGIDRSDETNAPEKR